MSQAHFSGSSYVAVTTSDSVPISFNALYVGTSANDGGTVVVQSSPTATAVTFKNVKQGSFLWVESHGGLVKTSSTASDIVALSW